MTRRPPALAALIVLVPLWMAAPAAAEAPPHSGNAVFDRVVDLVNEHFLRRPNCRPSTRRRRW